jgi:hypothetical protein
VTHPPSIEAGGEGGPLLPETGGRGGEGADKLWIAEPIWPAEPASLSGGGPPAGDAGIAPGAGPLDEPGSADSAVPASSGASVENPKA